MKYLCWLNINIGCIEMLIVNPLIIEDFMLNINIGCIEIYAFGILFRLSDGLNINIGCIEIVRKLPIHGVRACVEY